MSELEQQIAVSLRREASLLSGRWHMRVTAGGGNVQRDGEEIVDDAAGPALVHGLASALIGDARGMVELARAGWEYGSTRYRRGTELLQVLRELQLLEAVILYAAEGCAEAIGGAASDGLRVARGMQRGTGLLSRAASQGFMHAWLSAQRERASTLRHDIRNPLGTIRNAIAFLQDESIPPHMRDLERFRRMIVRNAAQADALVNQHLGDSAVMGDALVAHPVSMQDVALAVRRGLREEAREAGVEIIVADTFPVVTIDATTVELVLLAVVAGALEDGASQRLSIGPDMARERSVRIRVEAEFGDHRDGEGLSLARELAHWAGGELSVQDAIILELPLSSRQARGDLAGMRER